MDDTSSHVPMGPKVEAFLNISGHRFIGEVLQEYVNESEHAGWDGFTEDEVKAVKKFLEDVAQYGEGMA